MPCGRAEAQLKDLMQAAALLGVEIRTLHASTEDELTAAFSRFAQLQAGALAIAVDTSFNRLQQLGALALSHRVPAIYQNCEFVAAGGLMSYGGNLPNQFRLMEEYAWYGDHSVNGPEPAIWSKHRLARRRQPEAVPLYVPTCHRGALGCAGVSLTDPLISVEQRR